MTDFKDEDFEKMKKEAKEKAKVDHLERTQQFRIYERYPDIRTTIAYSLFHTDLRDSLLGLKLFDFYEFIQNFDKRKYPDEKTAGFIKSGIEDIFKPDLWRLQEFSLIHAFLSIFMAFESYLLKTTSGMTADFTKLTDKRTIAFLDYIFERNFGINGYFDYFNKVFDLNVQKEEFEGKENSDQWQKLNELIRVRNSIVHKGGIKDIKDQINMVKRRGELNNKLPEAHKITKKNVEDLRGLTIYFADQIELFFWEKMKDLGHDELM
jgi:hypothetical protein